MECKSGEPLGDEHCICWLTRGICCYCGNDDDQQRHEAIVAALAAAKPGKELDSDT